MTTLTQDIKAALEKRAATASGFPSSSNRAYEAVPFTPTPGTTWARLTFMVNSRRRESAGSDAYYLYQGLLVVDLFLPSGKGTGAALALADAVAAVFPEDVTLTQGDASVRVRYAEPSGGTRVEADWVKAQVAISWYVHNQT
jgi:hypothetical protein